MFQIFSDLLRLEGTWGNYELKPNSFAVLSDKVQTLTSKVLQTPPFTGKIFSVQECWLKAAVVYIPEASPYVSKAQS